MLEPQFAAPIACFRLALLPPWNGIDEARRYAESVCLRAGVTAARASEVAMTTHELLQNALAYASPAMTVRFRLEVADDSVSVQVTNETAPEHAARLQAVAARMAEEPDPLRHFAKVLDERPATGGGLGLARVLYEGEMKVDVKVRGRRVTVRAVGGWS